MPLAPGSSRVEATPLASRSMPWLRVAELAASQHGVVSRAQLRRLGLTDRQITGAARSGHLHRVHRGVYSVGHGLLTWAGRASAALLAAGPRAALGRRSAGAHWGIRPWASPRIEVAVAATSRPAHAAVVVLSHPAMGTDEVVVHEGLRVTTVARTVLDLVPVVSRDALRTCIAQAEVLRIFDHRQVTTLLDRHPGHRGAGRLREVLAGWEDVPRTRSPQEAAFPALCAKFGFPRPVMNATILGMEIDASFPDHGVAVELDSRGFHPGLMHWEDDHEKRARLIAGGWAVLSYTHHQQLANGGRLVRETLGPALARGVPVID
ncbi:type IV toxin-antitoxin system AbiEi family antitoxin domain-containing protein [Patulibacter sp. NPDC049589]|uniref:type IV toxin-antitoxin system AbiEi family antitoxin domain-containing protein n=1 Tax=Patulibacter sp. NPDC049589 TaxID=3154731 RepID=UPI003444EA04